MDCQGPWRPEDTAGKRSLGLILRQIVLLIKATVVGARGVLDPGPSGGCPGRIQAGSEVLLRDSVSLEAIVLGSGPIPPSFPHPSLQHSGHPFLHLILGPSAVTRQSL
jgi:hypothetical protein